MSAIVGQQLRQARQSKDLSLEKVARDTFIRVKYLQALEAGNLDSLPSMTQARGFLRTYAGYLDLDPESLVAAVGGQSPPTHHIPEPAVQSMDSPGEETAAQIFVEIGQKLKAQRDLLGISLEDIERQTHLKLHYLAALEAGEIDQLPSPVQGRGMLNNYVAFLGMEPDPILLQFAEGLQARLASRRGSQRHNGNRNRGLVGLPGPLRRIFSFDLVVGATLVIGLLVFVIWAVVRVTNISQVQAPQETAPSIADVLIPSETPSLTPSPQIPQATVNPTVESELATQAAISPENTSAAEIFIPEGEDPVQLYIVARQRTWLRITVDGDVVFEGRTIPGNAYNFSGRDTVELLTGSGSGLQVFYNQQDLGPMGLFGEVVNRVFTPEGILVPTPTITPTPTIGPTGTPTPTSTEPLPTATSMPEGG